MIHWKQSMVALRLKKLIIPHVKGEVKTSTKIIVSQLILIAKIIYLI